MTMLEKLAACEGSWQGTSRLQEGSYLVGHVVRTGEVTAHWIDSWPGSSPRKNAFYR